VVFSTLYEVVVPFTRDYEQIRLALSKIEHYDKTNLENVLMAIHNIFLSNWGNQNFCQTMLITDGTIGIGPTSLKNIVLNLSAQKQQGNTLAENSWLTFPYPCKLSIVCLGNPLDQYFKSG
jgi:Mg-chelatase subunit ChlD